MKQKLAIFFSGGGTTMEAIIKACQSGEINLEIACVITDNPSAGGVEKAKKLNIPPQNIVIIDKNENFGTNLLKILKDHGTTIVTQNGWMSKTPREVIDAFPDMIFNQHPGPVPEFGGLGMYGRRVHAAVLLFRKLTKRDFWTQVIAQKVAYEYDQGAVVKSATVEILPSDTVEDLKERTLPIEHQVQIELLKDVVAGKVQEVKKKLIVKMEDEEYLALAKKMAKLLYPHG